MTALAQPIGLMSYPTTRIWRCPGSRFYGDECLDAPKVYTDQELREITSHGFNGIWLRGRLAEMVRSSILPELNHADAAQRLGALRDTIERAKRHGIGVWLFFNEPLAPAADDPIWDRYPELKGQPHFHAVPGEERHYIALCTSHPTVQAYLRNAIQQVMTGLAGLGGILLITASEFHTHCWSHHSIIRHQYNEKPKPLSCPRCAARRPEEVVGELAGFWQSAARAVSPSPRVVAWNWSWSMWYPEPQKPVIDALPQGVSLMADWERGDQRPFQNKTIPIDEYSLSFVGPSRRFTGSHEAARAKDLPMFAKLQFGTTHELATVPNLPLIPNVHGKLTGLAKHGVVGFMGCWNFGCARTLNTYANRILADHPDQGLEPFCANLSQSYLGIADAAPLIGAWRSFAKIFEQYPFSIPLTYYSFFNYAPAYPLSLVYHGRRMGPSWVAHEPWGDDIETGIRPFTSEEVLNAFAPMSRQWAEALKGYVAALNQDGGVSEQRHRRWEESSCASMIGAHLRSAANIMRFHLWRKPKLADQAGAKPWTLRPDAALEPIVVDEIESTRRALELARADPRLGFHQECQAYFYTPDHLKRKLAELEALLPQCRDG